MPFMWVRLSFNEGLDSHPWWLINGSCEIMVKRYVIKIESFLKNEIFLLLRKPPMMTHDPCSSWSLEEATNKQHVHLIIQNQMTCQLVTSDRTKITLNLSSSTRPEVITSLTHENFHFSKTPANFDPNRPQTHHKITHNCWPDRHCEMFVWVLHITDVGELGKPILGFSQYCWQNIYAKQMGEWAHHGRSGGRTRAKGSGLMWWGIFVTQRVRGVGCVLLSKWLTYETATMKTSRDDQLLMKYLHLFIIVKRNLNTIM